MVAIADELCWCSVYESAVALKIILLAGRSRSMPERVSDISFEICMHTYHCLSMIELHTSCQSPLGQQPQLGDNELVELAPRSVQPFS